MKRYDAAFKEMVLDLLGSGQSISQLAKDYQKSPITFRSWQKKSLSPEGLSGKGILTAEQDEINA
ncbi:hypothetical protein [Sediminitomix flava]|uniref:Transposase n=1 Tax=Sediminitomix flava TaxID=379075 RepID=A0A315YZH2_SEDFL|nr:hypothetical protein [Sediminitomix flava]PWJ34985.1 hypothetical protein BC781_11026 [Sediminitomix flava]